MFDQVLIIAGVARSGTSWLGEIVNSSPDVAYRYQPLFAYAFKNRININSTREEYEHLLHDLYATDDPFVLQTEKRVKGIFPDFAKTPHPRTLALKKARYHYLLPKFLSHVRPLKIIGVVRHPCAVLASWMANPKEFPPGSDPWAEWRNGECKNQGQPENFFGFNKWREATNLFLDLQTQNPQRVKVVSYESLVDDPFLATKEIFSFAGLEYGPQTQSFLEVCNQSHSDNPYSVFKNKTVKDQWRSKLDPRIIRDIEQELCGTRLERFLA